MSEARINRISNELGTGGPIVSGITTFSNVNYFVPPRGTTAERPSNCPPGSIRFNTDSAHLEYFDGLQWLEMEAFNNELGVNGALGNRGLVAGGYVAPARSSVVDYITISTLGNAISFGSLSVARSGSGSCSSSTRGTFAGGFSGPSQSNTIDFVTISSTGNASSFGILSGTSEVRGACSNGTRGIFGGGYIGGLSSNVIEYITIASTGNTQDFGDLTSRRGAAAGCCASSTRGIFAGAYASPTAPATNVTNTIDYITISTTGNAIDFGDITVARGGGGGCSNSTRGLFAGAYSPSTSLTNIIDYVTIASIGNAVDFGDLTYVVSEMHGGMSSPTRAVWGGGHSGSGVQQNTICFVTILTTGNALDFGDLTVGRRGNSACSNGHGGL